MKKHAVVFFTLTIRSRLSLFQTALAMVLAAGFAWPAAQSTKQPPTVREVLAANAIVDTRQYPDYLLDAKLTDEMRSRPYLHIIYHINPSAEGLLILSRDLKLLTELDGWELVTLPDESVVYHNNQIHFAPTHSLEISVFSPGAVKEKKIYPPKPQSPVRRDFVERVAKVYKDRGEEWFMQHNHHMDTELFDSRLASDVIIDAPAKSISFNVRFGDPDNVNDPLPFTETVRVTCAPIDRLEQLECSERAQ